MNAKDAKAVKGPKEKAKKTAAKRKPNRRRAAARIRAAVDKTAAGECKEIVKALANKAKEGEVQSLKLFYNIATKAEASGEGEGARSFRSMAMELANSPEWKGPPAAAAQDEDDGDDD